MVWFFLVVVALPSGNFQITPHGPFRNAMDCDHILSPGHWENDYKDQHVVYVTSCFTAPKKEKV